MIACFSLFLARKTTLNSAAVAGNVYMDINKLVPVFGVFTFEFGVGVVA